MITQRGEIAYLTVELKLVKELGVDAALLFSLLRLLSRKFKKDDRGYFGVFNKYLMENSCLGHTKFYRALNTLVEARKIEYQPGRNQNTPARYKIVL